MINLRISRKKNKRVPKRDQRLAQNLLYPFFRKTQILRPHRWALQEIKAEAICAKLIDDFLWLRIVFEPFRHLIAIFGKNDSINDDMSKGRLVIKRCCKHRQ